MLLLWASWFKLCEIDIYKINVPGIVRYFSLAISIAGVFIFLISLFTIKALENYEGDLMTKGIYSKIRHPMYLSFITWLIGFSIFSEALFSLIFSIILISNILFWRYLEEKELVLRFPAYNEYKKRTLF
jgi:protein-S-isoprenylcysteine O-methyltransferase Ste14